MLAATSVACGGGSSGLQSVDIPYGSDLGAQDKIDGLEPGQQQSNIEIFLLHDTSVPLAVGSGQMVTINAKVIDYTLGGPAVGAVISYEITALTDEAGAVVTDGDAQLEVYTTYTNTEGIASNRFSGGLVGGRIYTVTLSTPGAENKSIQIAVGTQPCGCLNLTLTYEGGLPASSLSGFTVQVLPANIMCDEMSPIKPPMTPLASKAISSLNASTKFDCLPGDTDYTLYATGLGDNECITVTGCDEGVYAKADECRDVNIKVYLVTMNPSGSYDCVDVFDFSNLIKDCAGGITNPVTCLSGGLETGMQVCCVVYQLITFFNTPATTIYYLLEELAKQFVPDVIVSAVFGAFHDAVVKIVDDYIFNNSPQWVQDFFTAGQDILQGVTNLEMLSTLRITKLQNDFTVQGTHFWSGIALYWKLGCDPQAADYATCGRHEFSLSQLQDTQFPMNLIEGNFTASVADFDRLIINNHAINLNYGKLVLFVLNELVIKNITNGEADTLQEAVHLWINCEDVGNGLLGEIADWFDQGSEGLISLCNGVIDTLLSPLDFIVGSLTLDTQLSLQGEASMVDENCDLLVDRLAGGHYNGNLETSSSQQASFTAVFEATRQP